MLSFSGSLKVFVAVEPCDMRRSFNGLHDAVTHRLGEEPRSGAVFAFTNKRRNLLKILYWDRDGLALWYKRLEAGTFQWPADLGAARGLELDATQLALLLGGIDVHSAQRRKRYARAG